MAIYRQVHVSFWQDDFVLNLTPEEKFFYLYLMTNSKTEQCGIYELPKKIIEFETGYNRETVDKLLQRFVDYGKILYCDNTKEIMVLNWIKYNFSSSPKVMARVKKELKAVKNTEFISKYYTLCIEYGYSIDTETQEEEKEEEEEKEIYTPVVKYLNEKTKSNYRPSSKKTQSLIKARINEGFGLDDFKKVIDIKTKEWLGTDMAKYLRPETLFGPKFEGYLNQKEVKHGKAGQRDDKATGFEEYDLSKFLYQPPREE